MKQGNFGATFTAQRKRTEKYNYAHWLAKVGAQLSLEIDLLSRLS